MTPEVAAEFGQDAIFELTDDRMSVVGVAVYRRSGRGRLDVPIGPADPENPSE